MRVNLYTLEHVTRLEGIVSKTHHHEKAGRGQKWPGPAGGESWGAGHIPAFTTHMDADALVHLETMDPRRSTHSKRKTVAS